MDLYYLQLLIGFVGLTAIAIPFSSSIREINYRNIFKLIHSKKFQGILGMEHGNFNSGKAGEDALIKAYQSVDQFL